MRTLVVVAVLLVLSVPPAAVAQTVRRVPEDYPTVALAIGNSVTGDIIEVGPGTYVGNYTFGGKELWLRSTQGPAVTILDAGGTSWLIRFNDHETAASVVQGFTIRNARNAPALYLSRGSPTILDNIFEDNSDTEFGNPWSAIYGNTSFARVERNLFRRNSCDEQHVTGVVIFSNGGGPRVANNIFDGNDCPAIGISGPNDYAPVVVNNTIVRNRGGIMVYAQTSVSSHVYENNLIYRNDVGLELYINQSGQQPAGWKSNLLFDNDTDYVEVAAQAGVNGNVSVNPRLDRLSRRDYCLAAESPAIDAGSAANVPPSTVDFDGTAREADGDGDGSADVDIGAVEFAGEPCEPPADESGGGAFPPQLLLMLLGLAFVKRSSRRRAAPSRAIE
jgi:hypothetical protein